MTESLKTTTIRNVGYNSVAKVIQIVVMAVANIILTRTLLPSDYGIVSFAIIFTTFLSQFSDFGIGSAIIQKKDLSECELYTAFTVKFALGLLIFIVAFLCAPLAISFFDNSAIVDVIRVLALNFVLNTFSIVPGTILARRLDYKRIAVVDLFAAIANSLFAVTLAMLGFKYWSLVIASIVLTLCTCVLLNIMYPVRYRFAFNRDSAKFFMGFGCNLFISGFVTFLILNADNFIIGSVMGASSLGYYSLAFNWSTMIATTISSTVLTVLYPTFSRMQDNRYGLKIAYLKVLKIVCFLGLLGTMTLFVVSREFIYLILGHNTDKWLPALTTLRILCVYGVLRIVLAPVAQVVIAIARTDVYRKANIVCSCIELICLYPALYYYGIEGVAWLVLIAYMFQYFFFYRVLQCEFNISIGDLSQSVVPSLVAMMSILPLILIGEHDAHPSMINFIIKIVGCIIAYILVYGIVTKWKVYGEMRSIIGGL